MDIEGFRAWVDTFNAEFAFKQLVNHLKSKEYICCRLVLPGIAA